MSLTLPPTPSHKGRGSEWPANLNLTAVPPDLPPLGEESSERLNGDGIGSFLMICCRATLDLRKPDATASEVEDAKRAYSLTAVGPSLFLSPAFFPLRAFRCRETISYLVLLLSAVDSVPCPRGPWRLRLANMRTARYTTGSIPARKSRSPGRRSHSNRRTMGCMKNSG